MKQLLYGVKLMYRYMVGGEVYYEESVLRVRASSFDDVMDCFLMQESGGEIEEVYSAFHRNRTDLSENEYIEPGFSKT